MLGSHSSGIVLLGSIGLKVGLKDVAFPVGFLDITVDDLNLALPRIRIYTP